MSQDIGYGASACPPRRTATRNLTLSDSIPVLVWISLRRMPRGDEQAEDVAVAVDGDAHRDVDRPVGDLPVADLQERTVDQQHRTKDFSASAQRIVVPASTFSWVPVTYRASSETR